MDAWLKVSQFTDLAKRALEESFPYQVQIEGEISNWKLSSSGHVYFILKDSTAVLNAVMFRFKSQALGFVPVDGMQVRARGKVTVYAARGHYQLVADSLEQAGQGDILAALERLKQKLAAEGLFDPDRKKPLPVNPKIIGIVTSLTGSVLRDMVRTLSRRLSGFHVRVFGALVQGEGAAAEIERQIRLAAENRLADVLIVARGGGSMEDLLPFSDERVIRAIADSPIPVISAVGHETDTPLSDWAADRRASTPTAAAELVSTASADLADRIVSAVNLIGASLDYKLQRVKGLITLYSPELIRERFYALFQPRLQRLDDAKELLLRALKEKLSDTRARVTNIHSALTAANPYSLLTRGWALVRDAGSGRLISCASDAREQQDIEIEFSESSLIAQVKEKRRHEKKRQTREF